MSLSAAARVIRGPGVPFAATLQSAPLVAFHAAAYACIPLGGGRPMCVGYAFSMAFLQIALAVILQRFRLSLEDGARIDRTYRVTIATKFGMPMRLHPKGARVAPTRPRGTIREMVDLN
jgi:cytochrome P450